MVCHLRSNRAFYNIYTIKGFWRGGITVFFWLGWRFRHTFFLENFFHIWIWLDFRIPLLDLGLTQLCLYGFPRQVLRQYFTKLFCCLSFYGISWSVSTLGRPGSIDALSFCCFSFFFRNSFSNESISIFGSVNCYWEIVPTTSSIANQCNKLVLSHWTLFFWSVISMLGFEL